jgi:hypothetical protein
MANHKDNKYRGIDIKRGELMTGRLKLSSETGLSERQVRTALKNLQTTNEITMKSTTKYSIISIINYDKYQSSDQQNDQVATNKRPTSDQQATTNNNDNNDNNDNKKEEIVFFFEELKNILSKNYSGNISTRINSKNSKLILSKLLNKKDIVINGYKNYIEFNKNNNTELKYIKSLEVFLRNEVYEDYKELEPKTKKDNINILTAKEEW